MSEPTSDLLERIVRVLQSHRIDDYAFTGGVAVGVWAQPRQTRDVDVCGVLPLAEVNRILALHDGMRTGAAELPDSVRFRVDDWDVHLFVCKDAYDRACRRRRAWRHYRSRRGRRRSADPQADQAADRPTPHPARCRRRACRDRCSKKDIDWSYLRTWLPASEARLLEDVSSIADDELVQRLLHP